MKPTLAAREEENVVVVLLEKLWSSELKNVKELSRLKLFKMQNVKLLSQSFTKRFPWSHQFILTNGAFMTVSVLKDLPTLQ